MPRSSSSSSNDTRINSNKEIYSAVVTQQQLAKKYSFGAPLTRRSRNTRNGRNSRQSSSTNLRHSRNNATSPPRKNLAQKLGLEPEQPTINWSQLEDLASERGHFTSPCPICMDRYLPRYEATRKIRKVCLLSCGHVFHFSCLHNFEKFFLRQQKAAICEEANVTLRCPFCRASDYQKHNVTSVVHSEMRQWAAIQIQRVWRGYLRFESYRKRRFEVYPEERNQYLSQKLTSLSAKLHQHTQKRTMDIDEFLNNLDKSVAQSRLAMMSHHDWRDITEEAKAKLRHGHGIHLSGHQNGESRSHQQDGVDCAICMCPMQLEQKASVVTSCKHIFHEQCLESYEKFTLDQSDACVCPLCRSPFLKHRIE